MADHVRVTVEPNLEPSLRKLARALIALAQRDLAQAAEPTTQPTSVEVVTPAEGNAA